MDTFDWTQFRRENQLHFITYSFSSQIEHYPTKIDDNYKIIDFN